MVKRSSQVSLLLVLALSWFSSVSASEKWGDLLQCQNVIDIAEWRGRTFLAFMQEAVKPTLDESATTGYEVVDGKKLVAALENVSDKVKRKALRAAGSEADLVKLGNSLRGKKATLYTLPGMIANVNSRFDRYTLSTYVGLASCGGAVIKLYDDNYAYNIHYGTGQNPKDDRTGRSFGAGPSRNAGDASDKDYLTDLETFTRGGDKTTGEFYKTLLLSLLNTDTSNYAKISEFGQTLLTDFLAVYTAEQDRNLMDGRITLHWDAALLEVTLLSAFHSGQKDLQLMFYDPNQDQTIFTNTVYNQAPGGELRNKKRKASLIDYWQFSSSTNPEHKNRSGINLTKDQFRALAAAITAYEEENNPELLANIRAHLKGVRPSDNIFKDLSMFLINPRTPKRLGGPTSKELAESFTAFLMQVQKDADKITNQVRGEYPTSL